MQPDFAPQHTSTNLSTKLSQLSKVKSECTIYKVHDHLRNVNHKAYDPENIAIGPYHRDKNNIIMMEEHKLRYLQLILQRKNEHVEKFISAIAPLEEEARKCYAEPINLNAIQFVEMLVLDGCFIIELVRKINMTHLQEQNDPIFQMDWMRRDLILFENQIPFFVLCKLSDLIEAPNQHTRLIHLVLSFFHTMYPGKRPTGNKQYTDESWHEIKHLFDLIHSDWSSTLEYFPVPVEGTEKRLQFINRASWLKEANVKFQRFEGGSSLFDVRFGNGYMSLPPLVIEDTTETFFRNMIAYASNIFKTRNLVL